MTETVGHEVAVGFGLALRLSGCSKLEIEGPRLASIPGWRRAPVMGSARWIAVFDSFPVGKRAIPAAKGPVNRLRAGTRPTAPYLALQFSARFCSPKRNGGSGRHGTGWPARTGANKLLEVRLRGLGLEIIGPGVGAAWRTECGTMAPH